MGHVIRSCDGHMADLLEHDPEHLTLVLQLVAAGDRVLLPLLHQVQCLHQIRVLLV